jgi:hypothetical protein
MELEDYQDKILYVISFVSILLGVIIMVNLPHQYGDLSMTKPSNTFNASMLIFCFGASIVFGITYLGWMVILFFVLMSQVVNDSNKRGSTFMAALISVCISILLVIIIGVSIQIYNTNLYPPNSTPYSSHIPPSKSKGMIYTAMGIISLVIFSSSLYIGFS